MSHSQYSTDELFNVFIEWINLYDFTPRSLKNVYELSSGVILFKLLSQLSPTYFSIEVIDTSPRTQYAKNNNIIELKQCLEQFFNDVIDQDIAIDKMVDHNSITSNVSYLNSESKRRQNYLRLLEMVLLCSIKCENKHISITKMQSLVEEDQATLMKILQTLMTNTGFDVKDTKEENSKNNENKQISEKENAVDPTQTPTNFRRLSVASYSSSVRRQSLLSPFGSKTKSKHVPDSPHFNFDYTANDNEDVQQTLNFQHEINLKKDNITLYEKNKSLTKELDSLRTEHKETKSKYLKLKEELHSKQSTFEKNVVYKYKEKEKDLKIEIETHTASIRKYKEEIRYKNEEINEYKKALIETQQDNEKYSQRLQDIDDVHERKLMEYRDELDIAQHQSDQAYTLQKQIKQYQIRLESLNDLQNELKKYKNLHKEKCEDIEELSHKLKKIPKLQQQVDKYKKEMIQYKVKSIGAASTMSDKKIARKLTDLEDTVMKLRQENEELTLKLKTSRNEIRNLEEQLTESDYNSNNNMEFMSGITPEMQSDVVRLQAENKQLKAAMTNKRTMNDLMDELDTKTRLLQSTESQYKETKMQFAEVAEELENMKRTTAEWMRNSCSPQQYQNTLQQLKDLELNVTEKNKYIDQLKADIDTLREDKLSSSSKTKDFEAELKRTKQRYRDLYEYTEQQKQRLAEYKKAIAEMQSFDSNHKQKNFETQKYFEENQQLKEQLKIINQEMSCVQNACMNLLKRQVLLNNNLLSKPKQSQNNDNRNKYKMNGLHESRDSENKKISPLTMDKLKQYNTTHNVQQKQQQKKRQNVFINRGETTKLTKRSQIRRPSSFAFRK